MTHQNSVLLTVKIVIPTESRGMFQTCVWFIREPSFAALCDKVRGKLQDWTSEFHLSWWNKQSYCEIVNDQQLQQAIQEWFDSSTLNPSIYVTLNHEQPNKVYGPVPYDLEPTSVNPKRRKHHRLTHFRLHKSKSKFGNVSSMYLPEPSLPVEGNYYTQSRTLEYPHGSRCDASSPFGCGAYGNPTSELAVEPSRLCPIPDNRPSTSVPPHASPSHPGAIVDVTEEDEFVDPLGPAIETLRNMGFEQDEQVLRCCISQTQGDLNAIIDWLQAHEYS